jgi:phage shock protein PspC (stress-responsive transcriptional regulator)
MYRSFSDRVLGGVCGGLAAPLPVNAWVIRLLFIILTGVTLGAFAVLYLMLWLAVPQESLASRRRGGMTWMLLALLLIVLVLVGWYGRLNGMTQTPAGSDLYFPALGLVLSVIFFLRQLGRSV